MGPDMVTTVPASPLHGLAPDEARAFLLRSPELDRSTVLIELVAVRYGLAEPLPYSPETPMKRRAAAVLELLLPAPGAPDHPAVVAWNHATPPSEFMSSSWAPGTLDLDPGDYDPREALEAFSSAWESADVLACGDRDCICATVFFSGINAMKLEALAKLATIFEAVEAKAERDRRFSEELHAALSLN